MEQKINAVLARHVGRHLYGISIIDLRIQLSPDEATTWDAKAALQRRRDHVARIDAARHEGKFAVVEATVGVERAEHEVKLQALLQEHEQQRERREQIFKEEMSRRAAEAERALERERERHQLQMKQMRMEHYVKAFENGSSALLILHLSEHPDDVNSVVRFLMEQRRTAFENSTEMLKALIKGRRDQPRSPRRRASACLGKRAGRASPRIRALSARADATSSATGPHPDRGCSVGQERPGRVQVRCGKRGAARRRRTVRRHPGAGGPR